MKRTPALILAALAMLLSGTACNVNNDANSGRAVEQTVADQTVATAENVNTLPTMLELGSEGCKPCERMKPVMAGLEQDYGDKIRIVFHDVRKNQEIAKQYGIRLIPTQVFLDADGNEFFRHEGFFARDSIEIVFRDNGVAL